MTVCVRLVYTDCWSCSPTALSMACPPSPQRTPLLPSTCATRCLPLSIIVRRAIPQTSSVSSPTLRPSRRSMPLRSLPALMILPICYLLAVVPLSATIAAHSALKCRHASIPPAVASSRQGVCARASSVTQPLPLVSLTMIVLRLRALRLTWLANSPHVLSLSPLFAAAPSVLPLRAALISRRQMMISTRLKQLSTLFLMRWLQLSSRSRMPLPSAPSLLVPLTTPRRNTKLRDSNWTTPSATAATSCVCS